MKKHTINTDILPSLPEWATLVENKTYGKIIWNIKNTELYLSDKQKEGYISGSELREEMKNKYPANLAVLQFFVDNPTLFPQAWKGKYIYGWGTIVQYRNARLRVPCLCEHGGEVVLYWYWLDDDWDSYDPALRFASIESGYSNIDSLEPGHLELRVKELENKMTKLQKFLILE